MYGVWTYCPKCHREIAAPARELLRTAINEHDYACPGSTVHWVGDAPTSLHGNGAASFKRTTRDRAEVTCSLCLTLLDRESTAQCPKCGVIVTDQTPSTFYTGHDERCGGELHEPNGSPPPPPLACGICGRSYPHTHPNDPYADCACGHGRHTHVRYYGACGLCGCRAVLEPSDPS